MEKLGAWRDPSTGLAPFVPPVPPNERNLPFALRIIVAPLLALVGLVRTLLVIILLLFRAIITILFSILPIPPFSLLKRFITASIDRLALLVLGLFYIQAEHVTKSRGRSSQANSKIKPESIPSPGELIVCNWTSYVDALYLSFRYDPIFFLPLSEPPKVGDKASRISCFRACGLFSVIKATGFAPRKDLFSSQSSATKFYGIEAVQKFLKDRQRVGVIFPECTTSNNRGILRLRNLPLTDKKTSTQVDIKFSCWFMGFKHSAPTIASPISSTVAVPSLPRFLSPFPHIFAFTSALSSQTLSVRRKQRDISIQELSNENILLEWEEDLAQLTGLRRIPGLSWSDKDDFLNAYQKKKSK